MVKTLPAKEGRCKRLEFDPRVRRCPGGGHDHALQYSSLENPTDRGDWQAAVHRVAHIRTQLKQLCTHGHNFKISKVWQCKQLMNYIMLMTLFLHCLHFTMLCHAIF